MTHGQSGKKSRNMMMTKWPTSFYSHSLQRELAGYVILSVDNLVSFKQKELMNRLLKGLMSSNHLVTRVCHTFPRTPILDLNKIKGFGSIDAQALVVLNSEEFVTAHACVFYFLVDSVHCTPQCVKSPPCSLSNVHMFDRFFLHGVMTPALKSAGSGT